MRVMWLGMNDEGACVLHWHDLRRHLEKSHGVELHGPGYTWCPGKKRRLSELLDRHGTPDWIVLDDANARGYVPLHWDVSPDCRVAWREHDWHNGHRVATGMKIKPDLILGTTERDHSKVPLKHGDPFRSHPGWRLVPHPVSTERFHLGEANRTPRPYRLGFYGMNNKAYPERQAAVPFMRRRKIERRDVWLPTHGGYWRDGRGSLEGKTFYNDELAEALRQVQCLWVSGGVWRAATLKFLEGAASGCFLIGKKPAGWDQLFSVSAFTECEPEEIDDVVDSLDPQVRAEAGQVMFDQVERYHSIPARAFQIMGLLEEAA